MSARAPVDSTIDTPIDTQHARRRKLRQVLRRLDSLTDTSEYGGSTFVESLVSTILSQNTSDVNSSRAFMQLRLAYPSWDDLADADAEDVAEAIRCGGLARQKSNTIVRTLRQLREHYGGFEPPHLDETSDDDLLEELTSMRGIGLKTAACVLMFSLGRDLCAVDTHIHRIANRLDLVDTSNADRTFRDLRPLIPEGRAFNLHVALIRFGRTVCTARNPRCGECPLADVCPEGMRDEG